MKRIIIILLFVITIDLSAQVKKDICDTYSEITKKYGIKTEVCNARNLNKAGMALFKQKKYDDASILFSSAAYLDPEYSWAHFNFACMLAIKYRQTKDSGYLPDLFHHLYVSTKLNKSIKARAKKDNDFSAVKHMIEFKSITDNHTQNKKTILVYFKSASAMEGEIIYFFETDSNETITFQNNLFHEYDLANVESNEGQVLPSVTTNTEKVGKRFKITFLNKMIFDDELEIYLYGKDIISIQEQ